MSQSSWSDTRSHLLKTPELITSTDMIFYDSKIWHELEEMVRLCSWSPLGLYLDPSKNESFASRYYNLQNIRIWLDKLLHFLGKGIEIFVLTMQPLMLLFLMQLIKSSLSSISKYSLISSLIVAAYQLIYIYTMNSTSSSWSHKPERCARK